MCFLYDRYPRRWLSFSRTITPFCRSLCTERVTNPLQHFGCGSANNWKRKVAFCYYGPQGQGYTGRSSALQKASDEENATREGHEPKIQGERAGSWKRHDAHAPSAIRRENSAGWSKATSPQTWKDTRGDFWPGEGPDRILVLAFRWDVTGPSEPESPEEVRCVEQKDPLRVQAIVYKPAEVHVPNAVPTLHGFRWGEMASLLLSWAALLISNSALTLLSASYILACVQNQEPG